MLKRQLSDALADATLARVFHYASRLRAVRGIDPETGFHFDDNKRYIDAVQAFNTTVRSFPSNLTASWFGFATKPNFTVENEKEISKAPVVDL